MHSKQNTSRTPTKSKAISRQKPIQIYQNCYKILLHESKQQNDKWLIQNKITSFQIKSQKSQHVLQTSLYVLQSMVVQNQSGEQFLNRVIGYYKNSAEKSYLFCRCLRHFQQKDYQFQYISSVAKQKNAQPISFYLKCRMAIIDSALNKTKKQLLLNVIGDEEQWYKIVKKIFKNVKQQQVIQLYTDTIKYHYLNIKKNQHQQLNGAEILRICQIMFRHFRSANSKNNYYSVEQKDQYYVRTPRSGDDQQFSQNNKQTQVRRLFQKNVVDGLQSEDRQLIRILSYKDNNIAKLLQKKHEKMIELIADDVENMRKNIQLQKNKYIQLWKEKQQILRTVDSLNSLALAYVSSDSVDNEEKLLKAIQHFNSKWRHNTQTTIHTQKLRQNKKNKRLIQLIEKQQKQKY